MCGIIGIVGSPEYSVASDIYDGLLVLQHRGQDAAGIVTFDNENSVSYTHLTLPTNREV